ncbi:MAG: hypothetical protein GY793_09525 [Proteobacteria bacterium]|nr:hypothetical protein [Pseudomonadota bacterium]
MKDLLLRWVNPYDNVKAIVDHPEDDVVFLRSYLPGFTPDMDPKDYIDRVVNSSVIGNVGGKAWITTFYHAWTSAKNQEKRVGFVFDGGCYKLAIIRNSMVLLESNRYCELLNVALIERMFSLESSSLYQETDNLLSAMIASLDQGFNIELEGKKAPFLQFEGMLTTPYKLRKTVARCRIAFQEVRSIPYLKLLEDIEKLI